MSFGGWLAWGFGATVILTTLMVAAQSLGVTRMGLPYLLGTMFTADRDRARALGVAIHLLNGWIFSLAYLAILSATRLETWWFGAGVGAVHGLFVAAVLLPAMPGFHPRMARPHAGPGGARVLEPPGFFGTHYGLRTGAVVIAAHVAFGAVLGLASSLG